MFKVLKMFCGLILAASGSLGADSLEDLGMQTIRPEAVRAHVEFLADDLLEGRGTGTRGFELAAKYIAAQFEAMGLEPAGVGGTFFQSIRFRSAVAVPEETTLKLVRNGKEETLASGLDYYSGGNLRQTDSEVAGQIVYVRYGITAPDFGIDDYKGLDVRGKIVAWMQGAPPSLQSAERAHYSNAVNKRYNAAAHGAIGAIGVWSVDGEKIAPFSSGRRQSGLPTMAWLDMSGRPNGPEIRTVAILSEAGTKKLFGGSISPDEPGAVPASISIRTTSRHAEVTSPNVAAVLRGSDPMLRDEYVVCSAHADHLGVGQPVNGDSIYNGAMDNATGTAALIEIARAVARLGQRPKRSIIFLALTGEEKGLLGSDYFAEYPTVPRSQIVANVNIDPLNALFNFRDVVALGGEHSSLGAVAARAASEMALEVTPDPAPEQQYFVRSDHYSFVKRGIPAIHSFVGTKATDPSVDAGKITAEFLRSRYHQPNDDLSQSFDWQAAAKSTRFDFLLVYFIAQDAARPRWNDGDFFGKTFGNGL